VKLGDKVLAGLGRAGAAGLDQLKRTGGRVAGAVGSAAERIAETPAAEKLASANALRRVLKRASEAEARDDAPAAYALLAAEVPRHPTEPRLSRALLRAATACGRPADAAGPVLGATRVLASRGDLEGAAALWQDLISRVPESRADAGTLLRIAPLLLGSDPQQAGTALRHAIEPDTPGLTPGLAVRVAELARELDPETALQAAEIALREPDLHEKRRAQLHRLVMELAREARRAEAARTAAGPAISPDDVVGGLAPLSLRPPDLSPRARSAAPPQDTSEEYEDFSGWLDDDALEA
jgi:hypothetical protein